MGISSVQKRKFETCSGRLADSAFPGGDRDDVTYASDGGAAFRQGAVGSPTSKRALEKMKFKIWRN